MIAKTVVILAFAAIARAGVFELPQVQGIAQSGHHNVDYYAHPKYQFTYGVKDGHTGDHKAQEETRDGDVVKGYYTVADPDGTIRTVHYTADDHNGFNAVVEKTGQPIHPQAAPVQKILVASAPGHYHH